MGGDDLYALLEGAASAPDHPHPSLGRPSDERAGQIQTDLLLSSDALLMGRRTCDGVAPVRPTRSGDPCSDHINAMPKYVVSTTLNDPAWNNTDVIGDDVLAGITRLKESSGTDIVHYGFGDLSRLLLKHAVLDELRLWVHPLIVGSGGRSDLVAYDSLGELPQFGSMGFEEWLAQRTVSYHPMQGSQSWLV